jgi:hypothetical protein
MDILGPAAIIDSFLRIFAVFLSIYYPWNNIRKAKKPDS